MGIRSVAKLGAAIVLLSCWARTTLAGEIFSLVRPDCSVQSGIVINVEDNHIRLLTLDGNFADIEATQVDAIGIYNFVQNPIAEIRLTPELVKDLKLIYLEGSDKPSLIAWPTKFIESLVVFYDINGRSHVYELDALERLRPAKLENISQDPVKNYERFTPDVRELSARCPVPSAREDGVRPTRIISDAIKVHQFIKDFQRGYDTLRGYQERTYLYAKPLLYEQKSRLGFTYFPNPAERNPSLPLYFQWASGRPYRFQSFTMLGGIIDEFSPSTEPAPMVRSDVKAHLFHAHFAGNLAALPAGNSYYLNGTNGFANRNYQGTDMGDAEFQANINYMALMGADWGAYSLSAGYFYPVFGIRVKNEAREILANRTSYAVRFMRTTRSLRLRAIYSPIYFSSGSPSNTDILSASQTNGDSLPQNYDFNAQFARVGADYTFSPTLKTGLDGIFLVGSYKETDPSGITGHFNFDNAAASLYVRQDFSDYVAFTVILNWHIRHYDYSISGASAQADLNFIKYGGAFEFVF